MPAKVRQIDKNTWAFEEEGVRFFLLTGEDKALLIDSGMQTRNAKELAETLTDLPIELLNTHSDIDHVGSNAEFDSFYMSPAETENYKAQGGKGEIRPIREGDVLELGGRSLEIIELPGHTPGSVAVFDKGEGILFSGDPVQHNGEIFMFGPRREMRTYIQSLKKLEERSQDFLALFPSHGSCPVGVGMIGFLRRAAEAIEDGELSSGEGEMFGFPIRVFDLGLTTILCDPVGEE